MSQSPGYYGPSGPPQFRPPDYHYPPNPTPTPGGYPATPALAAPLPQRPQRPQRPAVVAMAATMTVTASLQWVCALAFAWLVATAGAASLSTSSREEGALFHLLNRFNYAMLEGLAWPLFGFAVAAFVLGFVILAPRPWTRWALTLTGLAALGWSAWWLRNDLIWWLVPALYIIVVCLVLWTPGASQWYRWRDPRTAIR